MGIHKNKIIQLNWAQEEETEKAAGSLVLGWEDLSEQSAPITAAPCHTRGVSSHSTAQWGISSHPAAAAGHRYSPCALLSPQPPAQGWGRIPCRSPGNPKTQLELWEHFSCFLVPVLCTLSCYSLDCCHSALQYCPGLSSTPHWWDSRLDRACLFPTSAPLAKIF